MIFDRAKTYDRKDKPMKTKEYTRAQHVEEKKQLTEEQLDRIVGGARRVKVGPGYVVLPGSSRQKTRDGGATGSW